MASLNLDLDFLEHRKVRRLKLRLGPLSEIYIIRLWLYVGKLHPEDGRLKGYSAAEIEGIIDWAGNPGEAVGAMVDLKFISKEKNGFAVKSWLQHSGHLSAFKKRSRNAAKAKWKKWRENKEENAYASSSAQAVLKHSSSNALTKLTSSAVQCSAITELTKDKDQEQIVQSFERDEYYLQQRMPFGRDVKGVAIQHLSAEDAEFWLNKARLSKDIRKRFPKVARGLQLRWEQKQEETKR